MERMHAGCSPIEFIVGELLYDVFYCRTCRILKFGGGWWCEVDYGDMVIVLNASSNPRYVRVGVGVQLSLWERQG